VQSIETCNEKLKHAKHSASICFTKTSYGRATGNVNHHSEKAKEARPHYWYIAVNDCQQVMMDSTIPLIHYDYVTEPSAQEGSRDPNYP
jgi:hypothetical protein